MTGWLGVVSRSHAQRGVAGGFAQVCHGKVQPLRRMRPGDWLIYYSPTIEMGGEALRAFTAIGEVADDEVFKHDMGGGFVSFRRRVRYATAREVPLADLKDSLDLCTQPNWGMALRRGHLLLTPGDFATIARAVNLEVLDLKLPVPA
jgi:hypothetical protein